MLMSQSLHKAAFSVAEKEKDQVEKDTSNIYSQLRKDSLKKICMKSNMHVESEGQKPKRSMSKDGRWHMPLAQLSKETADGS